MTPAPAPGDCSCSATPRPSTADVIADHPATARARRPTPVAPASGPPWRRDDLVPDLVLCSARVRTRQTWELVRGALGADAARSGSSTTSTTRASRDADRPGPGGRRRTCAPCSSSATSRRCRRRRRRWPARAPTRRRSPRVRVGVPTASWSLLEVEALGRARQRGRAGCSRRLAVRGVTPARPRPNGRRASRPAASSTASSRPRPRVGLPRTATRLGVEGDPEAGRRRPCRGRWRRRRSRSVRSIGMPTDAAYSRSDRGLRRAVDHRARHPPGERVRRRPRGAFARIRVMPSEAASGRDDLDEPAGDQPDGPAASGQLGDQLAGTGRRHDLGQHLGEHRDSGRPASVATRSCRDSAKSISPRIARSVISATSASEPACAASISTTSPVMSVESTSMTTRRRPAEAGVTDAQGSGARRERRRVRRRTRWRQLRLDDRALRARR